MTRNYGMKVYILRQDKYICLLTYTLGHYLPNTPQASTWLLAGSDRSDGRDGATASYLLSTVSAR